MQLFSTGTLIHTHDTSQAQTSTTAICDSFCHLG